MWPYTQQCRSDCVWVKREGEGEREGERQPHENKGFHRKRQERESMSTEHYVDGDSLLKAT